MNYYAVFDTNVLVSSLITKNKEASTAKVVDAIASGLIVPLYSKDIMKEYEEVLKRKIFSISESSILNLLAMIKQFGAEIVPDATGEILPDIDDLIFYEIVMDTRDIGSYLITGNIKHFPKREYIVTPAEMMSIITNKK